MSALGVSPEAVAATTGELNMLTEALVEVFDRLELLESQLRAVANATEAPELGDLPVVGRGELYVRDRHAAVKAGRFGERGLQRFKDELARHRQLQPEQLREEAERKLEELKAAQARAQAIRDAPWSIVSARMRRSSR